MKYAAAPDYQALSELEIMAGASNYNEWIWETIAPYIGNRVLEIGSGIGTFTEFLASKPMIIATDIAPNCIDHLKSRFANSRNVAIHELDIERIDFTEWSNIKLDTVMCINVLEHIENDILALRNIHSILDTGGKLILMVPAFQCVYGTIDKFDGHYRRYSKVEVISKLSTAEFSIVQCHFFNSIGLLAWYYVNRVARSNRTSVTKVRMYDRFVIPFLRRLESILNPPFGQSIIAVSQRS